MKCGTPHIEFALRFRSFLEAKGFDSPSQFHRDLLANMGKHAPALSTVWGAFYGTRLLPLETLLFLQSRYGLKIGWREVLPTRNLAGVETKTNQLALPGMREIKR